MIAHGFADHGLGRACIDHNSILLYCIQYLWQQRTHHVDGDRENDHVCFCQGFVFRFNSINQAELNGFPPMLFIQINAHKLISQSCFSQVDAHAAANQSQTDNCHFHRCCAFTLVELCLFAFNRHCRIRARASPIFSIGAHNEIRTCLLPAFPNMNPGVMKTLVP